MVEYEDIFNFKLVVFICLILLLILISVILHYTLPQYESFEAPLDLVEYDLDQEEPESPSPDESVTSVDRAPIGPMLAVSVPPPPSSAPPPPTSAFLTVIFKTNTPLTCGEVQRNIDTMYSKLNAKLAVEFKLNLQREHLIINELNGTLVVFIEVNSVDGEELLIRINGNPNMVFDLDITDDSGNVMKSVVFAKDTLAPGLLSSERPDAMVARSVTDPTTTMAPPAIDSVESNETPSKNIFQAMSNAIMDGITPPEPTAVPEVATVVPEDVVVVVPEAVLVPDEAVVVPEANAIVPEEDIVPSNMSELHLTGPVDDTYMNFYPQSELTPEETNKLVENMNQNMGAQYNIKPANFMD